MLRKYIVLAVTVFLLATTASSESLSGVLDRSCLQPPAGYAGSATIRTIDDVSDPDLIFTKWGSFDPGKDLILTSEEFKIDDVCPGQRFQRLDGRIIAQRRRFHLALFQIHLARA